MGEKNRFYLVFVFCLCGLAATGAKADDRKNILALAFHLEGKPYLWDASGPDAFDCSGFVWYVLRTALGSQNFTLPYQLRSMPGYHSQSVFYRDYLANNKAQISCDQSQPGDIVYFPPGTQIHSHLGIITKPQAQRFITAQQKGEGVKDVYSGPRSYWAMRIPQCFRNIWAK